MPLKGLMTPGQYKGAKRVLDNHSSVLTGLMQQKEALEAQLAEVNNLIKDEQEFAEELDSSEFVSRAKEYERNHPQVLET